MLLIIGLSAISGAASSSPTWAMQREEEESVAESLRLWPCRLRQLAHPPLLRLTHLHTRSSLCSLHNIHTTMHL